jgi:hypothetical protein
MAATQIANTIASTVRRLLLNLLTVIVRAVKTLREPIVAISRRSGID